MPYWKTVTRRVQADKWILYNHFSYKFTMATRYPGPQVAGTSFSNAGQMFLRCAEGASDMRERELERHDWLVARRPMDYISGEIQKPLFMAPSASITGSVQIEEGCTFWFNSVTKAQSGGTIAIGKNTHILDSALIRTPVKSDLPTLIGENVVIGEGATVDGATIQDGAVIGAGCVIMPEAVIGTGAVILPNSSIIQREIVPPFTVWGGRPAHYMRDVNKDEVGVQLEEVGELAVLYKEEMQNQIGCNDGKALYKLALNNGSTQGRRRVWEIFENNKTYHRVWIDFGKDYLAFLEDARHQQ